MAQSQSNRDFLRLHALKQSIRIPHHSTPLPSLPPKPSARNELENPGKQEQTYPSGAAGFAPPFLQGAPGAQGAGGRQQKEKPPLSRGLTCGEESRAWRVHRLLGLTRTWWIFTPLKRDSEWPRGTHHKATTSCRRRGVVS